MDSTEIRNIAIDSAENYYKYLDENGKGTQEVDVFEINYLPSIDLIIKLRLSAKLFDQESIFFKLLTNNTRYDSSTVKIIEYDSDKNILLIKPNDNVKKYFSNLDRQDIKVISDLKFLVKRVQAWYEQNGANIKLPSSISTLSSTIANISYLAGLSPSANQIDSLKSIFTNPFTYVWGAPGTGKTQFVLAYSVLHYIKNKKRVAILAPTNNSIEQVLRGVIKMTDQANIDRRQILRLGTPSRTFAEEFPEVCEEKGVQKRLDEIDKQIKIIEKVLSYSQNIKELELASEYHKSFDILPALQTKIHLPQIEFDRELSKKTSKNKDLNSIELQLKEAEIAKLNLQKSISSLSHKVKKFLTFSQTSQEKQLNSVILQINSLEKTLQNEKQLLFSILANVESKRKVVQSINSEINITITNIKNYYSKLKSFSAICSNLAISNWEHIKSEIKKTIEEKKNAYLLDAQLLEEYKDYSPQELQLSLKNYLSNRYSLASMSTQERLLNVNVIACTLDGYIGKFVNEKMSVDHLFVDEAGYANIVKALTLFNHSVPITFLGDHKQLPPVCEINDKIKTDQKYNNIFIWSQSSIYIDSIFNHTRDEALQQYLCNQSFNPKSLLMSSLNSTYRFGQNLTAILGAHVYNTSFTSNNPAGITKIFHIHANKVEEQKSRISINEVHAISTLVQTLKRNNSNDFIILTPYKKQVKLLGKHLPQERNELKILTVHGSQGREWHTVILSVVDTYDKWFVDSQSNLSRGINLINTAVSRAKNELIVVCDTNYWLNQDGQLITDLIRNGEEYN